jgi:hypothetical protein
MKALLLFHLHVGARVAIRSFIPIFAALIFIIMFQSGPAATATSLALNVFALSPSVSILIPIMALAILLPLWAAPRLSAGLNGWMRHLGLSRHANKRGLLAGLALTQIPLWISLVILGTIAGFHGLNVGSAIPRLCLLLISALYCALPVYRHSLVSSLALAAAACAFSKEPFIVAGGIPLLVAADLSSGNIREPKPRESWKPAESFFEFKIAWRALGRRLPLQYIPSILVIGSMALFANNNELNGSLLAATVRFAGCMAIAYFLSSAAAKLAKRRPPWPWARSLPVSSYRRVATDAVFLGCHTLPLLVPLAFVDGSATWLVLLTIPLISIRMAGHMRKFRERRAGVAENLIQSIGIFLEHFGIAALLAILPWTVIFWMIASVPAFVSARRADIRQKVSLWLELHFIAAGDSLNWSDQ